MSESVNPYNDVPIATTPQRNMSVIDIESNRAIAEVQAMVLMAKKFPRNTVLATDRILNECQRPGLAEAALYSYSRGGTEITGPSIRLAEVLARNWGNLDAGVKEISRSNGQSEMMSYCTDFETNYRQSKIFTVAHERSTKKGTYRVEDSRDVYEILANQASRRLRAAILAVIPGDVVEAAVSQCEQTLKAKADTSPDALKKLVEAFEPFKVSKEQIEKRIQRRLDTITAAQLIQLRKIYNSLKDGMSGPGDWFETVTEEHKPDASDKLKDKLKKKAEETVKESGADELAPAPCPNHPEDTFKKSFCDGCPERPGCPIWTA